MSSLNESRPERTRATSSAAEAARESAAAKAAREPLMRRPGRVLIRRVVVEPGEDGRPVPTGEVLEREADLPPVKRAGEP